MPSQQGKIVINSSRIMTISRQAWQVGDVVRRSAPQWAAVIAERATLR
ncbi:hypothetical protein [Roseovarius sp.]